MLGSKTKKNAHKKFVVSYGYGLFGLIVVGIIIGVVIPFSVLLFSPGIRYMNVTVSMVALAAGALVPMMLACAVGDGATRAKNKQLHHYNGVLFGALAYWLALGFSALGSAVPLPMLDGYEHGVSRLVIMNVWPILATSITIGLLAWYFHRSTSRFRKKELLQYGVYRSALFIAIILTGIVLPVIQALWPSVQLSYPGSFVSAGALVLALAISYASLRNLKRPTAEKLALSLIGLTFLNVAMLAIGQVFPYPVDASSWLYPVLSATATLLAIAVWVAYLVATRRAFAK